MSAFIIPQKALDAQSEAAHPRNSVWVSANAGSGKTHVLTERVIRLLLNGTEPARILCLTYTKAAAAVMQTRIFRTLSGWTEFDEQKLTQELLRLEGKRPDAKRLAEARRLFARALETPGGLKIQTIHAFCEGLLHQFPLEANIAGHFELMDELHRDELLQNARRYVLEKAYLKADPQLYDAFMLVLKTVGESGLDNLLSEAIGQRQALRPFLTAITAENGKALLADALQIGPQDSVETVVQQILEAALLPSDILQQCLAHGHSRTAEFVERLRPLAETKNVGAVLEAVSQAYFTGGKPRSVTHMTSKALREKLPWLEADIIGRQDILLNLMDKIRRLRLIPLNLAAFRLCDALLRRYETLKKADGLLDFDDLIERSLNLLQREGAGQWVQYKLDRGIDHILVDEAQDTSPAQWKIVQLLAQEFFIGKGQRDVERTVFAVGDEKQSIYSFQGAVPEDFDANGRVIEKAANQIKRPFRRLRLDFSFRSTADVLKSVDLVFESPQNYKGLSAENIKTVHEPIRFNDPGEVVIWEMLTPQQVEEPDDWRLPVDQLHAPAVRLAEEIANQIASWLKNGEMLAGKGRLMKASDIMVLVRKRDQFVPALARALKNRDVPVAGADRLQLTNHIAVRDLMALARFVLQPQDDLSLASVLKSPLFGLDEDDIYGLAVGREGSLWQSLSRKAQENTRFDAAYQAISKYRSLADKTPVFEFYSHILSEDAGRSKILARLGTEASDVLDAFMDYALAIQKSGLPGLQAFLETISAAEPEIKRELDQNREEVRIMTVHAAKGLEGAVVFLVDSGSRIWNAQHEPKLIHLEFGAQNGFLWQPSKDYKTILGETYVQGLKEKAAEEYRRLLYVGMTRAEDRLIVCGYRGKNAVEGTWAPMVAAAIKPHSQEIQGPSNDIAAWRYVADPGRKPREIVDDTDDRSLNEPPLPDFLKIRMAPEADLPKPLTPSGASLEIDGDAPALENIVSVSPVLGEKTANASFAIERGNIIHLLLQYLPQCDEAARRPLGQAYLARTAAHWSEGERQDAIRRAFDLMDDARLKPLFAAEARAEVSLMGVVEINGKDHAVSGQIDRLNVGQDSIVLGDFKTGRAPQSADYIPQSYMLQMALYRRLLKAIHPQKTVQTLLIYSDGPKVFELNAEKLDAMLYHGHNNLNSE